MLHQAKPAFRVILSGLLLISSLGLVACGSRQVQSTRLRADDFNFTVAAMAQSLAESRFLADRRPGSEPIYVTINRVQNLTTDIIPPAEQWMLLARVQGALPLRELADQRNIHFHITPEQHAQLRQAGFAEDLDSAPATTHVMSAVFMSAPRAVRQRDDRHVDRRQDYYYLEYSITEVQTRQVVWTDTFEFKREAVGLAID